MAGLLLPPTGPVRRGMIDSRGQVHFYFFRRASGKKINDPVKTNALPPGTVNGLVSYAKNYFVFPLLPDRVPLSPGRVTCANKNKHQVQSLFR